MFTKKLILAASIQQFFMLNSANAVIGPIKITLNTEYRTSIQLLETLQLQLNLIRSD